MSSRPRRPICPRAPLVALIAGGALAAGAAATGCSAGGGRRAPPSTEPEPQRSSCVIAADSAAPSPMITAAFDDTADARRALLATSRVAPLRLDCEGRPLSGLALAWSRDTSGRFWTFELDPRASADSGARWTASTLAAAWRADPAASAALRWSGVTSLVPLDDRRLVAGLESPSPEVPRLFADRALGVPRTGAPALTLAPPASGDLRDAIDQGTDLVQTADPALLDYARRRPGVTAVPLSWHRTYVLLLPVRSAGVGAAIPADTAGFQAGLARDAVRADARAAAGPFWWDARASCPTKPMPRARRAPTDAIAYPAEDSVARDLAERIVALAGGNVTARGLAADSFGIALRLETERGYVLGLPRQALVPCRESAAWPPRATVVPLVDVRPYALLRRGAPALAVEWDAAVRPAEAGDTAQTAP
jgi:hypothetical protein